MKKNSSSYSIPIAVLSDHTNIGLEGNSQGHLIQPHAQGRIFPDYTIPAKCLSIEEWIINMYAPDINLKER